MRRCVLRSCRKVLVRKEKESIADFERRKHCSRECQMLPAIIRAQRLPERECEYEGCGATFRPKSGRDRYCSRPCTEAAADDRRAALGADPSIVINLPQFQDDPRADGRGFAVWINQPDVRQAPRPRTRTLPDVW